MTRTLAQFSPEGADQLQSVMQDVFDTAFAVVMDTMTVVALTGAVFCALLIRKRS